MPIPYSNDLRLKALKMIEEDGLSQKEVSKLLSINRSTIFRWKKRKDIEGDCNFKGYSKNKHKIKIKDISKFVDFLEKNKSLALADMANKFEGNISYITIYRMIKRLGYSYKKNSGYIKNEMKRKEISLKKK
jgi:transposase